MKNRINTLAMACALSLTLAAAAPIMQVTEPGKPIAPAASTVQTTEQTQVAPAAEQTQAAPAAAAQAAAPAASTNMITSGGMQTSTGLVVTPNNGPVMVVR